VITVIGGMLVTVGGGVILAGVIPGLGGDSSDQPIVVRTPPPATPTVITVTTPSSSPQAPKETVKNTASPPAAPKQPAPASPPPPSPAPPPAAPPPPATTVKVVTTAAGTMVPAQTGTKLLGGRLLVKLGRVGNGTIAAITLRAEGSTCTFERVRPGEGVGVYARRLFGVKVVTVSAAGATLKAATARAPRGATCRRTDLG